MQAMADQTRFYEQQKTDKKFLVSIAYMLGMGICGVVLSAIGATITELAAVLDVKTSQLGTIFLTRGVGAIIGAGLSAKLFKWYSHRIAYRLPTSW